MRPPRSRATTSVGTARAPATIGLLATLVLVSVGGGACGGGGGAAVTRGAPTLRNADGASYLAHEVIVRIRPGVTEAELGKTLATIGGKVVDAGGPLGELGFRRVSLPTSITADVAISRLTGAGTILKAEPNYVVQASATPADPRYGELWGMTKISAPAAWDLTTGAPEVLVAVSDTGIDYNHPDLVANAWTNPGEIPGNGKDDDGNGYVDDVHGYDFANSDGDPADDNGHGTHCSGTIGAAANNGIGVAGVNWKVKIVGAKFLGANGSGSSWGGAQTVLYAAKVKARVVSASWGCLGGGCYASYMEDALRTLEAGGGIFIAAAGNNANNNEGTPTYPANYNIPSLVAVAATDGNDNLASFSNYGNVHVHVGAPGVSILSTLPGGGYASWNGTSMATPHVAGAAALFLSLRPDATPAEIKQQLIETCDPVPALSGKVVSGGRINVRKLVTAAGKPPAAPAGFNAVPGSHSDVLLSWNANTESELATYRVRWGTATGVYPNSMDVPKTVLSAQVASLTPGTRYFFVVYAVSQSGLSSAPSVERSVTAADTVAPPQVVDLAAVPVPGGEASGEVVAASGDFSPFWAADNAHDGSPDTAWISPGRAVPQEESLTVGLFSPFLIDAVDLLPSAAYPGFFPVDFDIELSTDGESWTSVGGLRNATATAGTHVQLRFAAALASHVRLRVLRSAEHPSGLSYAAVAEMAVFEASSMPDGLRLSWTAPGDDPGVGRAARYDVRRASAPLTTASFDGATIVPVAGQPLASGLVEQVTVSPLGGESTYYFALKAIDAAGNVSPMSNVASATTLLVPPSTITDLQVLESAADTHPGMVTLGWTAPGGDGMQGQAARYELRMSSQPLTPGNFAAATAVAGVPMPGAAGTAERFAVSDLAPGEIVYFAIRAFDGGGAAGGLSNVVAAEPTDGDDTTPPATVGDLSVAMSNASLKLTATVDSVSDELSAARAGAMMLDGSLATAWQTKSATGTTPAWVILDFGKVQPLARFRMNPSTADLIGSYPQDFEIQVSSDKQNWTAAVHVEGMLGQFGAWNEWLPPVRSARYARLYVTRRGPAAGAGSYVAVGELEAYALTPALDADLTWVAPGDDGYDGRAARYELRRSNVPLTAANFAGAQTIATLAPLPGGMIEVVHLPSLPSEATSHFAVRAVDTTGNWSGISNVATLATPGLPPAPVADLAVTGATKNSVSLTFTASGDDGTTGTATAYELRYATTPITPATWAAATLAPSPPPATPGSREAITVAGLEPTTLYYFAMLVIDDVENRSLLSNVVAATTRDGTAPATVADLAVSPVDPAARPALTMTVADSSGSYTPETQAKNLLDATESTEWISPASATMQTVSATFELGGPRRLGRLRMRSGSADRDLFPVDFKLEVQAQANGPWTAAVNETGFTTAGGWEEWMLGSVPAVAARLVVTKTVLWAGKYITALADLEVYEDPTDFSKLRLSWTAPGDDGAQGTATAYDLRRAGTAIAEATFAGATPVAGVQKPQAAGYLERFEASGLSAETTTCFALKAIDEEGNASATSNSGCATTPGIPPATVTDLKVAFTTAKTATLTFTAPGSDGNTGRASRYELRRSSKRINTANWAAATVVSDLPAPATAGAPESITVAGLTGLSTYFFALRAVDSMGAENASALSNNASGTTLDDIPPSRVMDLAAATDASQGGALRLTWTAPGDNGTVGTTRSYDVRVSTTAITDATFAAATPVTVPAPAAGGTPQAATITGLGAETLVYVALRAIDTAGNVSAVSNVASARTREEAPAAVNDLTVIGGTGQSAQGATLVIQWTAPGDDATTGTASGYDIRTSTTVITSANFAQAATAMPAPAPAQAGTVQKMTIGGLGAGTKIYVALKTIDDRGNLSGLSNVASATTPDEVPPATILDLMAAPGATPGTLTVSLTAPGDDGTSGRATSYELRWSTATLDAASFSAAALLTAPTPAAAGTVQMFTVTGLPHETDLHLMVRTRDDAGNVAAVSNDARATTPMVSPAAVSDLRTIARGVGTMTLAWTASGDDAKVGTAAGYDLRVSTTPLTDATFATATPVPTGPAAGAGSTESATATGLAANKTYYFALKVVDDRGNWSPLSNVATAASEDTVAPGAIVLGAAQGSSANTITLSWIATGDDGTQGTAARYELRRAFTAITAATWGAATTVTTLPPKAAGTAETMTVTGLKGESTHHFAIRAVDEADNVGPLSNDAAADTAPVAPATINLAASLAINNGQASATLTFAAPGDDGTEGQASGYDLRRSTSPISAANFASATTVTMPAPGTAGTGESVVVPALAESTTYYFAIKAVDDTQTWSALSNVATVVVPDLTKPASPAGLSVGVPDTDGKVLTAAKVTPSSVLGPSWQAANATDGDATSSWASAGSNDVAAQSLVVDLGTVQSLAEVRLTADAKYLGLFPRGFTIAVSADNAAWKAVVTEQAFSVTSAAAIGWGFPSESARYVRIAIDDTGISYGQHYAILAEVEVLSAAAPDGRAQLTWLAPGDDGTTGKATRTDVFRHTSVFGEATLGAVTPVAGAPTPLAAGALQAMTVTGLHGETTYFWAVRAVDEAGNVGPLSAVVSARTNNVPPAAVRTLGAKATGNTTVDLSWTATGDDGLEGVAASYEIRYLSGPISAQNFSDGTLVPNLPAPAPATVPQSVTVSGLTAGVTYRFALRAKDAGGNASFLSNVAVVKTNSPPDVTPPAAITDLTVAIPQAGGKLVSASVTAQSSEQSPDFKATSAADGNRNTFWASTPRAATQEEWVRVQTAQSTIVDRVHLWPSFSYPELFPPDVSVRVSPDGLAWTAVASASNITAAAGVPVSLTFAPTTLKFIEVRATRLAHPPGGLYYAAIAEIEAYTANEPAGTMVASWTSPSDDGPTGGAASYDLRVGACPFTPATATAVTTAAPLGPASPERARITGKTPGTYCVAIRSADAAGNFSPTSNVVQILVP